MCLSIKNLETKIAEEDIVVYKHAIRDCNGDLMSPYQFAEIKQNELLTNHINGNQKIGIVQLGKHFYPFNSGFGYYKGEVYSGFHSCLTKRAAIKDMEDENGRRYRDRVVFKCVIPKGSEYIMGDFVYQLMSESHYYEKTRSIVSSQIIYKEIIHTQK